MASRFGGPAAGGGGQAPRPASSSSRFGGPAPSSSPAPASRPKRPADDALIRSFSSLDKGSRARALDRLKKAADSGDKEASYKWSLLTTKKEAPVKVRGLSQPEQFGSRFASANAIGGVGYSVKGLAEGVRDSFIQTGKTLQTAPNTLKAAGMAVGNVARGDRSRESAQRVLDEVNKTPFGRNFGKTVAENKKMSAGKQLAGIGGQTLENVLNVAGVPGAGVIGRKAAGITIGKAPRPAAQLSAGKPLAQSVPRLSTTPFAQVADDLGRNPALPGAKPRKFTESVRKSDEVSSPTKSLVQETYVPKSNKSLLKNSEKFTRGEVGAVVERAHSSMVGKAGTVSDQNVSDVIAAAKKADEAGQHEAASGLYDKLAIHLTESGRAVQAASLLSRRTPQGLVYSAQKALKEAGIKVEGEVAKTIQEAAARVKATAEGSAERARAVAEFEQTVHRYIPSSTADKLGGLWKAGLLTSPVTHIGNAVSNTTLDALGVLSKPGTAAVDKALSLVTGQRTATATLTGKVSGAREGFSKIPEFLRTGIDERALTGKAGKYEQGEINFKNPAVQAYVNGVFRAMGAGDRPTYYSNLRNSLADIAKANGLNQGLKGDALAASIKEGIENPTKKAVETATREAEKSVLANKTALGSLASGARQVAEQQQSPIAREALKGVLTVLAPFTKTPSAFLARVVDYTPVGAIKEVAIQASNRQLDQRSLSKAISEAGTGTGIIWLGAKLADSGQLSGSYPADPQEKALWQAEGKKPNSIKIGDSWVSLNYFGPNALLLGLGKNLYDSTGSLTDRGAGAVGGLAKGLTEQSFLQGLNAALGAVQDSEKNAGKFVNNLAGSVVPSIVGAAARASDPMERARHNSPVEAIKNRVPGLRQQLEESKDLLGRPIKRSGSIADTLFNPGRISSDRSDALTAALKEADYVPSETPKKARGRDLSEDEYKKFTRRSQELFTAKLRKAIADPDYQDDEPEEKKLTLGQSLADARRQALDEQFGKQARKKGVKRKKY